MTQNGQASRRDAASTEPSWAELLDPAALEARLAEAKARRAEALARRAQSSEGSGTEPRARIRTIDMGAEGGLSAASPAGPAPARRTLRPVEAPQPAPSAPPARADLPAAPAIRSPFPQAVGDPTAARPIVEAIQIARGRAAKETPEPVLPPVQPAPSPRSMRGATTRVLGVGLLVGAVSALAFFALRPTPLPEAIGPAAGIESASVRPSLRFSTPPGTPDTLGFGVPAAAPQSTTLESRIAVATPAPPTEPLAATLAEPEGPPAAERSDVAPAPPALDGRRPAALPTVEALPALSLATTAGPALPGEVAPARMPAAGPVAPLAPAETTLPDLGLLMASLSPPPLPSIAEDALRLVAAAASDGFIRSGAAPALRFAVPPPEPRRTAAIARPALPDPKAVGFTPPAQAGSGQASSGQASSGQARAAQGNRETRAAAGRAPAGQQRAQAATRRPAPAQADARIIVRDQVRRSQLERSVEDLLRDRLLGN